MDGLDPDIFAQIRTIIRRDLKLRPDEPLDEDMRLFGSNIDLDSLDMLLLLTSIERHFGVRVPSQEVGREVFQTVGSLARYVQDHRGGAAPVASSSAPPPPPPTDWLAQLPHGPEFRFVSRVTEVRPGASARGVWAPGGAEPFFAGHFPGNPVVPGVLIAEALAQVAGLAGPPGSGSRGALAQVDVRFEQPARPPVEIELLATLVSVMGPLQKFDVTATVASAVLAHGSITLHRSEPGGQKT